MKLVGGLTLRKLATFPQSAYLQPHLEELDKELQAIESTHDARKRLPSLGAAFFSYITQAAPSGAACGNHILIPFHKMVNTILSCESFAGRRWRREMYGLTFFAATPLAAETAAE